MHVTLTWQGSLVRGPSRILCGRQPSPGGFAVTHSVTPAHPEGFKMIAK